jgi:hypothetical protein
VLDYLQGTKDLDHLEEEIKAASGKQLPEPGSYLGRRAYLFNCMWSLLGKPDQGTLYFSEATNSMNLLDQFFVSRGLFYGKQKLRMLGDNVEIFTPPVMTTPKGRPRAFDKKTKKGYSDHFPITSIIQTL